MKTIEEIGSKDIEKVKRFLEGLGFLCNSCSSAQHLVYSKNVDVIIIKNNKS
jgi:hypothetical protein